MPERKTGSRTRETLSRISWPLLLLAIFVALWKVAAEDEWLGRLILPAPEDVASSFFSLLGESYVWDAIYATVQEAVGGYLIGIAVGVSLALAAGLSTVVRKMVYPYIIAVQVTPVIAIAPILIAWLGFGLESKLAVVALVVFFPVFVNTLTGLVATDSDSEEMFRSLGAGRLKTFAHLRFPNALPFVFAGLKLGVTLSLVGAVVAEFVSADQGLGVLIQQSSYQLNMDDAYALLFMLTIIGLTAFALVEALDRAVVFWTHDGRMAAKTRRREQRDKRRNGRTAKRADGGAPNLTQSQTEEGR